ncbi:hypothetical protein DMI62_14045 [Escherichia coli]|nr:hypothetical protein [Escherichia coli]
MYLYLFRVPNFYGKFRKTAPFVTPTTLFQ